MSGKSARLTRQALRPHKFPKWTEENIAANKSKESILRDQHRIVPDAPVDHGRRIGRLAKSQGITIQDAIEKHAKRIGLKAAPRNTVANG